MSSDLFQNLDTLSQEAINKIIERLEFRGTNKIFAGMRDRYLNKLHLQSYKKILEIGAGTGVVSRAIASTRNFDGEIVAIELNDNLLKAGVNLAKEEQTSHLIQFIQGDAENLKDADESYDLIIMHTVLSHLKNPIKSLFEAFRVLKKQGLLVIFDADFSSCAFSTEHKELDTEMINLFLSEFVANSTIMQELPTMQQKLNMEITAYIPELISEIGEPNYFYNFIKTYSEIAVKKDLLTEKIHLQRINTLNNCLKNKSFFGSCNFYTYFLKKLD